jgi:hypothetical protein
MVDYGRHSETAQVLVSDEGLAIQSLLKIQSTPLGNLRDLGRQSLTMLISMGIDICKEHFVPNREREKRATP